MQSPAEEGAAVTCKMIIFMYCFSTITTNVFKAVSVVMRRCVSFLGERWNTNQINKIVPCPKGSPVKKDHKGESQEQPPEGYSGITVADPYQL